MVLVLGLWGRVGVGVGVRVGLGLGWGLGRAPAMTRSDEEPRRGDRKEIAPG